MDKSALTSYRFSSNKEPSEAQLKKLMEEVAQEAKRKFLEANARLQEELRLLCISKRK
jgi:hypothetical protein